MKMLVAFLVVLGLGFSFALVDRIASTRTPGVSAVCTKQVSYFGEVKFKNCKET